MSNSSGWSAILRQMSHVEDVYHAFPLSIDAQGAAGNVTRAGGDALCVHGLRSQVRLMDNGEDSVFRYIFGIYIDANGELQKREFVTYSSGRAEAAAADAAGSADSAFSAPTDFTGE